MAFWNLGALQLEAFRPGIMSKAELGNDLIMVCMEIGAKMEDSGHTHTFDQCGIVLEGQIKMFIGYDRKLLNANETYFIPSGQEHSWRTFDKSLKILDITAKQTK